MTDEISTKNEEINLVDLLKTIWAGKYKIILTVFIFLIIGSVYAYYKSKEPSSYQISLKVEKSLNSEFVEFIPINKFLENRDDFLIYKSIATNTVMEKNVYDYSVDISNVNNNSMLNRFMDEIKDYDEYVQVLKNTSKLSDIDAQSDLMQYSETLTIEDPNNLNNYYVINFVWHDKDEGLKMLEQILNLVEKNLQESVLSSFENILHVIKDMRFEEDKMRINYLREQSAIAKELNFDQNQVKLDNSLKDIQYQYYLNGYIAIDKEISLILQRDHREVNDKIEYLNDIRNNNDIKWVNYRLFTANVKNLNKFNKRKFFILIIFIGLFLGTIYILIEGAIKSQKNTKKT